MFLDRNSPQFMGGFLEMANARLYPVLGRPHRGAAHRPAAERDQAHRRLDVRRALQQAGAARAVHGRDERHLRGQLPGLRREVRLLPLPHALRRRRRDRPALDARRPETPAPALHLARTFRPPPRSRRGRSPPRDWRDRVSARVARLLRRAAAEGRRDHDGHDPSRLEPREEDAPHSRRLRRPAARRRVRRRREPDRRRAARERVRADDVAQHADRVRRRVRLHRRRLSSGGAARRASGGWR